MEPAANNVTNQLQNCINQMLEADQQRESNVLQSLWDTLKSLNSQSASQPGVRESLEILKQMIRPDTGISKAIIYRINELWEQKNIQAQSPPKFVRFTTSNINIHENLANQLKIISDNLRWYHQNPCKDFMRQEIESHTFGIEPLMRIDEQLCGNSPNVRLSLLSAAGVKEAFISAINSARLFRLKQEDFQDALNDIHKRVKAGYAPAQPEKSVSSAVSIPAAIEPQAAASEPQAQVKSVVSAAINSVPIEGQPQRGPERDKVDQLASFVGALQRGDHSQDLLVKITLEVSEMPVSPHPEMIALVKELAKELKSIKEPSDWLILVIELLEGIIKQHSPH